MSETIPLDQGPMTEGLGPAEQLYPDYAPQLAAKRFNPKATLSDICKDHVLFTHASLILFSRIQIDPVQSFMQQKHPKDPINAIALDTKIFDSHSRYSNLGAVFDYLLLAAPKEIWTELVRSLGTVSVYDPATGYYGESVIQKLPFVDVVARSLRSVVDEPALPVVDVFTCALESTKAVYHYYPGKSTAIEFKREAPDDKLLVRLQQTINMLPKSKD